MENVMTKKRKLIGHERRGIPYRLEESG